MLSTKGGALGKMLPPFKMGVGGPLGTGKQWMPWIHIDDLVGAIRFIIDNEALMGAVNGTAPNPVTNADFSKALGKALHRPAFAPAPAFAIKLAFGEMAEILLEGQRVLPAKLLEAGYEFQHPEVLAALRDIVEHKK